jgi:hypothetical protein
MNYDALLRGMEFKNMKNKLDLRKWRETLNDFSSWTQFFFEKLENFIENSFKTVEGLKPSVLFSWNSLRIQAGNKALELSKWSLKIITNYLIENFCFSVMPTESLTISDGSFLWAFVEIFGVELRFLP